MDKHLGLEYADIEQRSFFKRQLKIEQGYMP